MSVFVGWTQLLRLLSRSKHHFSYTPQLRSVPNPEHPARFIVFFFCSLTKLDSQYSRDTEVFSRVMGRAMRFFASMRIHDPVTVNLNQLNISVWADMPAPRGSTREFAARASAMATQKSSIIPIIYVVILTYFVGSVKLWLWLWEL
jgi:hypothetical protein